MNIIDPITETIDGLMAWLGSSIGQLAETHCSVETADDHHTLAAKDGSLISIIKIHGATFLIGPDEFASLHTQITQSLQATLARPGHALQVFFLHDKELIVSDLEHILHPAKQTAERLGLQLDDLFAERINNLKNYCSSEKMYFVLWTTPASMTKTQFDQANKNRIEKSKKNSIPAIRNAQNLTAAIPELRNTHDSFVRSTVADLNGLGLFSVLLDVHDACYNMRQVIDPDYTDRKWRATLPGDKITAKESKNFTGKVDDILWPPLAQQLIPRDGENIDLRTARIGDRIYSSLFIDLFPKEIEPFSTLFNRIRNAEIPWRISFMIESGGLGALGMKPMLATILSFASQQNKLITDAAEYLNYIQNNTDDSIVKLKVTATTWAHETDITTLRTRSAELAKAIQGWGYCEVSEISGDAYAGVMSSALGLSTNSIAQTAIAPLSDVVYMLPFTRPASPWSTGAVLLRSPDGKPWPYQPGSTQQTTWIDLIYARPGSGKSVLSNSINLALCLSSGLQRLPRIAIIDIGPSSSGLISLIKEALPDDKKHLAAYHRLRMTKDMAINPFDTQVGCRYPTSQERAFLVNFLTLIATPVGEARAYDGIADMVGLIVNELYKNMADNANANRYNENLNPELDKLIQELEIKLDSQTTWWEITDQLFQAEHIHEAAIAQRYAMPLLADAASICRTKTVEDLYGDIKTPTGESLINAFGRMISSAVREYPILSCITSFDLGDARVVSLDLDEVAKSGGEAADRQTAIMYMLARYVLARHYYLTEDAVGEMPKLYQEYHSKRILEIREDPKRIVFDEFHRTSKAQAVRDQVLVDMREGRKWKVQVALLSQSLDDFDPVMIEFCTSTFIMDAGPKQAIEKSARVFGLSETAQLALATRVHGPRADGATFLAQFATKSGVNTQLITSTIGPIELWAFNTTAEDVRIRNELYKKIGASAARKLLAMLYPTGSAAKVIEERLEMLQSKQSSIIAKEESSNVIEQIIEEILEVHRGKVQ
ncbi:MAG: type IV secretion protein IcmB [Legionellales bacterium]|nr:MAG: type IV secretion protein IcmB [Legionellales bacterium]